MLVHHTGARKTTIDSLHFIVKIGTKKPIPVVRVVQQSCQVLVAVHKEERELHIQADRTAHFVDLDIRPEDYSQVEHLAA